MPQAALAVRLVALALTISSSNALRTLTIKNECNISVWPVVLTLSGAQLGGATGWEAHAGTSLALQVPDLWTGRIWARTGCNFDDPSKTGETICESGGCSDGLICKSNFGGPPASLIELTTSDQMDYYDVSLMDGFNLPLSILPDDTTCEAAQCLVDMLLSCPEELQTKNASGGTAACMSSCYAHLDANPTNSSNCCSGSFSAPDKCTTDGVKYYTYFHGNCPSVYASAFDDQNALHTCNKKSGFTVSFCPGGNVVSSSSNSLSQTSSGVSGASPSSSLTTPISTMSSATTSSTSISTALAANRDNSSATVGAIAGVAAGVVVGVALLGIGAFFLWRRKRRSSDTPLGGAGNNVTGTNDRFDGGGHGGSVSPFTSHFATTGATDDGNSFSRNTSMRAPYDSAGPVMLIGGGGSLSKRSARTRQYSGTSDKAPPVPTTSEKRSAARSPVPHTRRPDAEAYHGHESTSSVGMIRSPTMEEASSWNASDGLFNGHASSSARSESHRSEDTVPDASTRAVRAVEPRRPRATSRSNITSMENPHRDFPPPAYASINYSQQS